MFKIIHYNMLFLSFPSEYKKVKIINDLTHTYKTHFTVWIFHRIENWSCNAFFFERQSFQFMSNLKRLEGNTSELNGLSKSVSFLFFSFRKGKWIQLKCIFSTHNVQQQTRRSLYFSYHSNASMYLTASLTILS